MTSKVKQGTWFEVSFEGTVRLGVEDIWPDGDAPENPTSADVVAVMRQSDQTAHALVRSWCMDDELTLHVLRFPTHYAGDPVFYDRARYPS